MKNVNLTGLYLALIAKYNVNGFSLHSIVKIGETEPIDAIIDFTCPDVSIVSLDDVKLILDNNITGEVLQATPRILDDKIHIYIEFLGDHWNDDYAYNPEFKIKD